MQQRFADRVAVVTGAGSGIGAATAKRLACEGARVVAADIDAEAVDGVVAEIGAAGGMARSSHTDLTDPQQVRAMIRLAVDQFGRLDVLHNNATRGTGGFVGDMDLAEWEAVLAINLTAPFVATRYALPIMIDQGGGVIINMASAVAFSAEHGLGAYAAAKAGVVSLTRSTAIEYGRHNIRANCVVPGAIATPPTLMFTSMSEELLARVEQASPQRRMGRAEEVAAVVAFLASDEASFVNGAAYFVDGGAMATHNIGLLGHN